MDTAQLKKVYNETIAPALQKQFNYSSAMQIPVLKKIVINQGLGDATQDKKIIDVCLSRISVKQNASIFSAIRSTVSFNDFMKQIGHFRNATIDKKLKTILPYPTFDTALFRFNFLSQLHFDIDNEETGEKVRKYLMNQKILILFCEGGRVEENHPELNSFELVIEVSPSAEKLYEMTVVKAPELIELPFKLNEPKLISSDNLTNEIGFVMFIYVSIQVNDMFVKERVAFLNRSKLFGTENAPTDGIELMTQIFSKMD